MTEPKRPRPESGWEPIKPAVLPSPATLAYRRRRLVVFSSLGVMDAPDGSGDSLPTWLVSVSRVGAMPTEKDLKRVRRDFGLREAEEDNHEDGNARKLFLVVDPSRRVDCECKTDERVVTRSDGYRYTIAVHRGLPLDEIAETDAGLRYLDWLYGELWKDGGAAPRPPGSVVLRALGAYLSDPTIKREVERLTEGDDA